MSDYEGTIYYTVESGTFSSSKIIERRVMSKDFEQIIKDFRNRPIGATYGYIYFKTRKEAENYIKTHKKEYPQKQK